MADRGAVGFMGPFGYGNLGDASITESLIRRLRADDPDREIRGFTLDPRDTHRRHGVESYPLSRTSFHDEGATGGGPYRRLMRRLASSHSGAARRIERVASHAPAEIGMLVRAWRALSGVEALVVCGSGQIQDYWGGGGPWSYPYTMLRWGVLARLRRAQFIVLSVGAGPVDSALSRRFFRWALSLASYRSYRDDWSRRFVVEEIGLQSDDPVVPDLAFGLDIEISPMSDGAVDRRVVGIGPMGYFRDGSWPEADAARWNRYRDAVVGLAESVIAQGDQVLFLKGEAAYDQVVIDEMVDVLRSREVDTADGILSAEITTLDELLHAIHRCDTVVASRFHNILLAYVLGRPSVGLAYQAKTESLMMEYGQEEFCLPIGEITSQRLVTALEDLPGRDDFAARAAPITEAKRIAVQTQYEEVLAQLGHRAG